MSPRSISRKTADFVQKRRGRQAFRFQFDLLPICASDLPQDVKCVSFVWKKGSKTQATKPSTVNVDSSHAYWEDPLRQTTTLYKDGKELMAKEYTIKLQSCPSNSQWQYGRRTISRGRIDLAKYCKLDDNGHPKPPDKVQDVEYLKPFGRVKVQVQALWLKDRPQLLDDDCNSVYHSLGDESSDQDASGFDSSGARSSRSTPSTTPKRVRIVGDDDDENVVAQDVTRLIRSAPSSPHKARGLVGRLFSSTTRSVLNDKEWETDKSFIRTENDVGLVRRKALEILEDCRTYKGKLCDALRVQHGLENEVHSLGLQKKRLLDRIRVLEDAMVQNTYDNLVQSLIETKVSLAESDFSIHMLRGQLFRQSEYYHKLMNLLDYLNIDYKGVISGSIDRRQCRPASLPNMRWWWQWFG